jgi:hypothetical protein
VPAPCATGASRSARLVFQSVSDDPAGPDSMASPHVAGLAGLLAGQGRSRDQVRTRIESAADRTSVLAPGGQRAAST